MGRSLALFGALLSSSVVAAHAAASADQSIEAGQAHAIGKDKRSRSRRRDEEFLTNNSADGTNNSNDGGGGGSSAHAVRVKLPPFTITLRPTPFPLRSRQAETVEEVAEKVIEDYLLKSSDSAGRFEDGVSFSYVSLLGVDPTWVGDGSLSYCGTDWADADYSCNQPCTFGAADDTQCPDNQRCFANTNSCPSSNSDRRERRTLLQQGGGDDELTSSDREGDRRRRRLESESHSVLRMAGGLATFRVDPAVNPAAEPPTPEVLGTLAALGITSDLAGALRDLDDEEDATFTSDGVESGMYTDLRGIATADAVSSVADIPDEASPEQPDPEAPNVPTSSTPDGQGADNTEGVNAEGPDNAEETYVEGPSNSEGTDTEGPSKTDGADTEGPSKTDGADTEVGDNTEGSGNTEGADTEGAEGNDAPSVMGITMQEGEQSRGNESNPTGAIAGAVVGVALVVLLTALFLRSRTRKKRAARECGPIEEADIEGGDLSSFGSADDFDSADNLSSPRSLGTIPEKSGEDFEDESTVDSSTIWSVENRKTNGRSPASSPRAVAATSVGDDSASLETETSRSNTSVSTGVPMHPTDSFEIRRQFDSISVRKDMMLNTNSLLDRKTHRTHAINTERNRQRASADMDDSGNLLSNSHGVLGAADDDSGDGSAFTDMENGSDDMLPYPQNNVPIGSDETWDVGDEPPLSTVRERRLC